MQSLYSHPDGDWVQDSGICIVHKDHESASVNVSNTLEPITEKVAAASENLISTAKLHLESAKTILSALVSN